MLLRDYYNSVNFYRNGELSRNQIGRSSVLVKKENEKFTIVCSRSPKELEFSHFPLLLCRGQQRNVPKYTTHEQNVLLLLFGGVVVVTSTSSLLKLPNNRELKQRRRRRQRHQTIGLMSKNNRSARAFYILVHFFAILCKTTT